MEASSQGLAEPPQSLSMEKVPGTLRSGGLDTSGSDAGSQDPPAPCPHPTSEKGLHAWPCGGQGAAEAPSLPGSSTGLFGRCDRSSPLTDGEPSLWDDPRRSAEP